MNAGYSTLPHIIQSSTDYPIFHWLSNRLQITQSSTDYQIFHRLPNLPQIIQFSTDYPIFHRLSNLPQVIQSPSQTPCITLCYGYDVSLSHLGDQFLLKFCLNKPAFYNHLLVIRSFCIVVFYRMARQCKIFALPQYILLCNSVHFGISFDNYF